MTARFAGKPLVRHVAEAALASRAAPVLVVLGHAADAVANCLEGLPLETVSNLDHATGLASSLEVGLAALPLDAAGAIVLLGDMPLVSAGVLDRLIETFEAEADGIDAVVPTYRGRDGNPVLIGRAMFEACGALHGDEGARRLLAKESRHVARCAVDDPGIEIDIDTREVLKRLAARQP